MRETRISCDWCGVEIGDGSGELTLLGRIGMEVFDVREDLCAGCLVAADRGIRVARKERKAEVAAKGTGG